MPSYLFTQFDVPAAPDLPESSASSETVYRFHGAFEKILAAHGCGWFRPEGDKYLAVFENERALWAAQEALAVVAALPGGTANRFKAVVHQGDAFRGKTGWFGPHWDHAHRLLEAAPPGNLILSQAASVLPLPTGFRRYSLGIHLLKDLWEPEELFTLIPMEGTPPATVIPRSLGAYRQNLTAQPTPFLGRQEELRELAHLLENPRTRLVTLRAPGGFGKTRLALQLAADSLDRYDGVFWLAMAPLSGLERMTASLASVLGLVLLPEEDPVKRIVDSLAGKRVLLVFDNFEHLPEGKDLIGRLLEAPTLQMVVTSHISLNLPAEQVFPIGGFQYPSYEDDPNFEEYSAVQLFHLRMRRSGLNRVLTLEEKPVFLELCRLLHGMPLGLEIAGALIGEGSLAALLEGLREQVETVGETLPHLPDRQKSLRAVFDYSWELLDGDLKRSLSRLSVLKGVFNDHKAREAVRCPPGDLEKLSNRSLLIRLPDGKYQFHEIVRLNARERLFADPSGYRATREAHARHFLTFLQARLPLFCGPEQRRYLVETDENISNIQDAFLWAAREGITGWSGTALDAYGMYFERRSKFLEGWDAMRSILRLAEERNALEPGSPAAEVLCARLLTWKSSFEVFVGKAGDAIEGCGKALRIFEELGQAEERSPALVVLGRAFAALGRPAEAEVRYRKALAQYRKTGDERGSSYARNLLCQILLPMGNAEKALQWAEQSLRYAEVNGDISMTAWCHLLLGRAWTAQLDFNLARRHLSQAFEEFLSVGNRQGMVEALTHLGQTSFRLGEAERARSLYREAITIQKEFSYPAGEALIRVFSALAAWHLGQYAEARRECEISLDLFRRLGDLDGMLQARMLSARLSLTLGDAAGAERIREETVREHGSPMRGLGRAWFVFLKAEIARAQGRMTEALRYAFDALRMFRRMKDLYGIGWIRHFEGEMALERGNRKAAEAAFREAMGIAWKNRLVPILLECSLGWARVLEKKGLNLKDLVWVEAVLAQPQCAGLTLEKAKRLQTQFGAGLSLDDLDYARQNAQGADLFRWCQDVLESPRKKPGRKKERVGQRDRKKGAGRKKAASRPRRGKSPRPKRRFLRRKSR